MSDRADKLVINDRPHHPPFSQTHLPDAHAFHTSSSSLTRKPNLKNKARGVVSPGSNRGVADLLNSLNESFGLSSSSRTSSADELAIPLREDLPPRQHTPELSPTLSAKRKRSPPSTSTTPTSAPAVALTSSYIDLRSQTPPQRPIIRYPRSTLISPRRVVFTSTDDRVASLRFRPDPDEFYRANLDELEAWTKAAVSPVVFGDRIYAQEPSVDAVRAATRFNLRALRRTIDTRPAVASWSGNDEPSAVAKPERMRAAICQSILNDIFTPEPSVDDGASSGISSRASPILPNPNEASTFTQHTQTSLAATTSPTITLPPRSFSGNYSSSKRPHIRRPLQDLPISSPAKIPALRFRGSQIAKALSAQNGSSMVKKPESKQRPEYPDPPERSEGGLEFMLRPDSALYPHPHPSSSKHAPISVEDEDDVLKPFEVEAWPFPKPVSEHDFHASTSFDASTSHPDLAPSQPLLHSPSATLQPRHIPSYDDALPDHATLDQHIPTPNPAPMPHPLPLQENNASVGSQSSVDIQFRESDDSAKVAPAASADVSDDTIEIFSPMVLEEQERNVSLAAAAAQAAHAPYLHSNLNSNPFQLLFDPILSSSLASESGEHFMASPTPEVVQAPMRVDKDKEEIVGLPEVQEDQMEENVALDENEFFNFDAPMADGASVQSEGSKQSRAASVSVSASASGPATPRLGTSVVKHDVDMSSPLQDPPCSPPVSTSPVASASPGPDSDPRPSSIHVPTSPGPDPLPSSDPVVVPMAQPQWPIIDVIPSSLEDTSRTPLLLPRKRKTPVVLDEAFLRPRYRNFWATEDDNPYLRRARSEMVVGKVRVDLVAKWEGGEEGAKEEDQEEDEGGAGDDEAGDDEEQDELENDVESEDEEVVMQDPDSGVVFLSQVPKAPISVSPKRRSGRRPKASTLCALPAATAPASGSRKARAPEGSQMESASTGRRGVRTARTQTRYKPYDSKHRGQQKGKKGAEEEDDDDEDEDADEEEEGSEKMREGLGERVARWEALFATFIKGKRRLDKKELLELKKALVDILSSAAYISPASALIHQVGVVADMQADEIPGRDRVGLRALAKELVKTWS